MSLNLEHSKNVEQNEEREERVQKHADSVRKMKKPHTKPPETFVGLYGPPRKVIRRNVNEPSSLDCADLVGLAAE